MDAKICNKTQASWYEYSRRPPQGLPSFTRFNVAYGAPAPREGVQPEEGGTLQGWGYIRVLPGRGYRANSHANRGLARLWLVSPNNPGRDGTRVARVASPLRLLSRGARTRAEGRTR